MPFCVIIERVNGKEVFRTGSEERAYSKYENASIDDSVKSAILKFNRKRLASFAR